MKQLKRMIHNTNRHKSFVKYLICLIILNGTNIQIRAAERFKERQSSAYQLQLLNFFQIIENNYAPLQFKEKSIGLNWEKSKNQYQNRFNFIKDSNEYSYLFSDILSHFNDAHVSIELPSTLSKKLPFQIMKIKEKYLVNYINSDHDSKSCPIEIGDELVHFNDEILNNIQKKYVGYNKFGNDLTNDSLFALKLTNSEESSGNRHILNIPNQVKLRFRSITTKSIYKCEVNVKTEGVGLVSRPIQINKPVYLSQNESHINSFKTQFKKAVKVLSYNEQLSEAQLNKIFNIQQKIMNINKLLNTMIPMKIESSKEDDSKKSKGVHFEVGRKEPLFQLPSDFEVIDPGEFGLFLNSDGFYAGTFNRNNQRVGFLRIPSYMPTMAVTMNLGLRYYIQKLSEKSDYLILDQTNNPGGLIIYSDLVIKSLVGDFNKIQHMKYLVKPTQSFLRSYIDLKEEIVKDVDQILTHDEKIKFSQDLDENYKKIYNAYLNRQALSEPISMLPMTEFIEIALDRAFKQSELKDLNEALGVDLGITKSYDKPIYMLINQFDFSAGDSVPATLQDYKRVTLIGERTAGAGGTVEGFTSMGVESFMFQLTTSLMRRSNGQFIENYGVKPDYQLEIQEVDVKNKFSTYLDRVLNLIGSINKTQ